MPAVLSITGCFRLGEQAQVDWAHFGTLAVGRARRPLMAFVMVLSYSRHLFLRFYLNATMGSFLHGHVAAFTFFNAVPRTALPDYVARHIIRVMCPSSLCGARLLFPLFPEMRLRRGAT